MDTNPLPEAFDNNTQDMVTTFTLQVINESLGYNNKCKHCSKVENMHVQEANGSNFWLQANVTSMQAQTTSKLLEHGRVTMTSHI